MSARQRRRRRRAPRRPSNAAKVVAVTGHGGATLAYADVVLPAAVQHERNGTVTNIEGRVTNVTAKIVAPGLGLARRRHRRRTRRGVAARAWYSDSVEGCAKAIEETTGYPALSVMNDVSDEGAVVGRVRDRVERRPLDPMAFPGIRSTNTVGLGELTGALIENSVHAGATQKVATLDALPVGRGVDVGHYDAYGLALNISRRLYDHGIMMQGSPALANLVAKTTALLNHFDLDRLGLATGDEVQVNAPSGPISLPVAHER
jgi:anaerobic selenocysteine-containing dehydrogenase